MEFEKAVFRIYERTVEGFAGPNHRDDSGAKYCKLLEFVVLSFAVFYLAELVFIHHTFVGQAGCLPELLQDTPLAINSSFVLPKDQILQLNLEESLRDARQPIFAGQYVDPEGESDEVLFMRALPFDVFSMGKRWLSSHGHKNKKKKEHTTSNHTEGTDKWTNYTDFVFTRDLGLALLPPSMQHPHDFVVHEIDIHSHKCFGSDLMQLALPSDGIDVVTMNLITFTFRESGTVKISPGSDYRKIKSDYFSRFPNFGLWLINRVVILIRSLFSFIFVSTSTSLMIRVLVSSGVVILFPLFWLFMVHNFSTCILVLILFILLTLLFHACIQMIGGNSNLLHPRIIALSYPWIGVPMEVISRTGVSVYPFVLAHFVRLLVYYFMFQATQLFISLIFYDDDVPGMVNMWLFAIMMTAEYFSMVYVRSVQSIQVFPRATLALFLLYHFYIYVHPTGFHLMALWVFFLFELVLMMFCISQYEVPAYVCGEVSEECPRYGLKLYVRYLMHTLTHANLFISALHNSLPWPTWTMALAPDYSLFLPVTHRAMNIYGIPSGTTEAPAQNIEANNESDEVRNDNDGEGITMNVMHSSSREHGSRSNSDESLDVEVGRLEPIAIGSSVTSGRGNQTSRSYAVIRGDPDEDQSLNNSGDDEESSY